MSATFMSEAFTSEAFTTETRQEPVTQVTMTREQIIAAVQECAAKLGHAPSMAEFRKILKLSKNQIRKNFGTYSKVLEASGLERRGAGYPVSARALFLDWATIARNLGKIPTMTDYELFGKYSPRPILTRYKTWGQVPAAMLKCASEEGLGGEWEGVLKIIADHLQTQADEALAAGTSYRQALKPRILEGQPTYGQPLMNSVLTYAPTNEAGVVLLFGSVARELGFAVLRVQTEFPDCEAMRQVEKDRWQRVRIEFEYESRNFVTHMHVVSGCDLIVCWSNNWPECPLEVLELRKIFN
jgi:hypothetical protein